MENISYEENNIKPKKFSKRNIIISILLILIILICAFLLYLFYVKKEYAYVTNLSNLPDPIQQEATGGVIKYIDDYEIKIDFKASYSISGKVVDTYYYFPYKIFNKLSRFDVGLAWGLFSDNTFDNAISFKNTSKRRLSISFQKSLINQFGSETTLLSKISNNHMIHADDYILRCLRNVKKGQHVKFEGYLSYVTLYKNNSVAGYWNSSLSRTDTGDNACEVFYVTKVVWLKQA